MFPNLFHYTSKISCTRWVFCWEDTQTDWSRNSLLTVVLNTVRCLQKFERNCQEMIQHCRSFIWWKSDSCSWMMWQLRNSVKLKTATGLQFWRTVMIMSILTELGKLLEIISKFLLKKICGGNWNIRNHGLMNIVQNFREKLKSYTAVVTESKIESKMLK